MKGITVNDVTKGVTKYHWLTLVKEGP